MNCTATFQTKSKAGFSQYTAIEHSENKIITHFENEVGPGVLWSSNQQTYNLQKFRTTRTESTYNQLHVVCAFGILAALMFVECWTGALGVQSRFQTSQIENDSIFGMLYCIKPIEGEKGKRITEQSTQKNLQLPTSKAQIYTERYSDIEVLH